MAQVATATPESPLFAQVDDAEADYAIIEKRMIAAVQAGEMTREDATKALSALRRSMFGKDETPGRQDRGDATKKRADERDEIRQAVEDIEKQVRAGTITREQANRQHEELRRRMAGADREASDAKKAFSQKELDEAKADMKKLVASGVITEAEAEARLAEMRRMVAVPQEPENRGKSACSEPSIGTWKRRLRLPLRRGR